MNEPQFDGTSDEWYTSPLVWVTIVGLTVWLLSVLWFLWGKWKFDRQDARQGFDVPLDSVGYIDSEGNTAAVDFHDTIRWLTASVELDFGRVANYTISFDPWSFQYPEMAKLTCRVLLDALERVYGPFDVRNVQWTVLESPPAEWARGLDDWTSEVDR